MLQKESATEPEALWPILRFALPEKLLVIVRRTDFI